MKALILAAGPGTRMKPHSERLPKPAFPFLNVPLLYYPLHMLERLSLTELAVNVHHLPERLMPILRSIPEMNFKLHISDEQSQLLGSGGGIGHARTYLQGNGEFCVVNGDELIFPSNGHVLSRLQAHHRKHDALATLLVMKHPQVGKQFGGVWTDSSGRVHGFGKSNPTSDEKLTGYHFTGFQILSDRIFDYIPKGESNIFYDVLKNAIAKGEKILGFENPCVWYETGNPSDFLHATHACLEQMKDGDESPWLKEVFLRFWHDFEARPSLWEGQNCHHHLGSLEQGPILLGDGVKIHGSVEVEGFAVIGSGTRIGEGSKLKNCVVGPKVQLAPGTVLENELFF